LNEFDILPALKGEDSSGEVRVCPIMDIHRVCQHPVKPFSVEKGYGYYLLHNLFIKRLRPTRLP